MVTPLTDILFFDNNHFLPNFSRSTHVLSPKHCSLLHMCPTPSQQLPRLVPGVAACPPVHPLGTLLLSETWKSSARDRREGWAPVSPLHICFPERVSWRPPGHLPRGSWRETAFDLRWDKLHGSPKPFFFFLFVFPPRTMIAFLMRILFKK